MSVSKAASPSAGHSSRATVSQSSEYSKIELSTGKVALRAIFGLGIFYAIYLAYQTYQFGDALAQGDTREAQERLRNGAWFFYRISSDEIHELMEKGKKQSVSLLIAQIDSFNPKMQAVIAARDDFEKNSECGEEAPLPEVEPPKPARKKCDLKGFESHLKQIRNGKIKAKTFLIEFASCLKTYFPGHVKNARNLLLYARTFSAEMIKDLNFGDQEKTFLLGMLEIKEALGSSD